MPQPLDANQRVSQGRFPTLRSFIAALRQLTYPPEFRIQRTSGLAEFPDALIRVMYELQKASNDKEEDQDPTSDELRRCFSELATGLWRLREKLVDAKTGAPIEETKRLYRYFEHVLDVLREARVEIHAHDGVVYDAGMELKVIAFQPIPGLETDRVIETIRPTVYYKGSQIQVGEIIVGTPEDRTIPD